ncbi:MAG TPA: macro domain-containing protein [Longimicrobiales bacterium]|nr:macro domain-containing protein [Longimicrobiales bacterium]
MIQVVVGALASQPQEGVLRAIRSDGAPLSGDARDVLLGAGSDVVERLGQMGDLPVGGAFVTPGGTLPASFIIHVVTASEEEPETAVTVQRALRNGLRRAAEWEMTSLALPPLGLGVGRMDPENAARAMVEIITNHLDEGLPPLDLTIVVGTEYEAEVFRRLAGDR